MDKNKKVVWFCGMQIVIFLLFLSVLLLHWRAEIRPGHGALTILWVTMIFLTLMGCALTFVIWDYIRGVVKFASYLARILTENSFLARYGGDEFVIVEEHTTLQKLDRMNCKLQKLIDEYNQGAEHPISYAVGYEVSYRNHYYLVPDLIRTADEKMYEDKRYKKQHRQEECRPCCYASQLVHSISSEHLAAKIRMAMHGNQERKTYAFIMSDVQDFRLINDYWGYDTGNKILDTVLKRIETYEDVQFARRFHSDVFVSLLDVTGQDLAGVQQRIEANNKEIEAEIIKTFPVSYFVLRTGICIYLQLKMGGKTEKSKVQRCWSAGRNRTDRCGRRISFFRCWKRPGKF